MSAHHLDQLLSPYRAFNATGERELRQMIRNRSNPSPVRARIDTIRAAQLRAAV